MDRTKNWMRPFEVVMIEITLGLAVGTMLIMALVMSYILGWANKKFHVETNPLWKMS